ncbi:MAG TPA: membrane or secreted protein [Pirellulaceae bacterium]|nr:membrane or secreted protein [Pirellulaceae bacterium]
MNARRLIVALAIACVGAGGCASNGQFTLFNPGTVNQQRLRATIHDPYSDQDLAPEVVGGRPRDYLQQLPEPVRNRLYVDSGYVR